MALFSTGPDFLTGILGAQNSDGVLNKFKKANTDYKGLDAFENRYGQLIGDDGYLTGGAATTEFYDTDGDGIDDRLQSGPGQPKAGFNPNASPVFGGNQSPGSGGGDNPNSPGNTTRPVSYGVYGSPEAYQEQFGNLDFYDPERSLYADYVPSNLKTVKYGDIAPGIFETGYDLYNMVPTTGKLLTGVVDKLLPESVKDLSLDDFLPESVKTTYSDFISNLKAKEDEEEKLSLAINDPAFASFLDRYQSTPSYSDIGLDFADDVREEKRDTLQTLQDLNIDTSDVDFSDLSLADYENTAMDLTNQYNTAIRQQAEREEQEKQAEQDRINSMVASGMFIGTGYNPQTGNYSGLLKNTNPKTGITSNVMTGYNEISKNIQNENYQKFMQQKKDREDAEKKAERERIAAAAKAKEKKGGGYSGKSPSGGQMGSTGGGSGQSGPASGSYGGSSFCFAPDTLIQMADGSEKEIQNIKLGDDTKGGKVELVVQTLGHDVYNYKGVEVSGSHWVVEDGKYIEVETSKHAKPIDDKEMLYCLNTSDHAIWIKDIQFSDFIGFGLDYSVPGVHKFWESIKDRHTKNIN